MTSIIDKFAAVEPTERVTALIDEYRSIPVEVDDMERQIAARWNRRDDIPAEIGRLIKEDPNTEVFCLLAEELMPDWARGELLPSLSAALRDSEVWPTILLRLSERGVVPVFNGRNVKRMARLSVCFAESPPPEPCAQCLSQEWAATIQQGSLLRICGLCRHTTTQPIPPMMLPPPPPAIPGQVALW